MRIAVFLFALVASALLLPAVAHAQEPTGSISGQIVFKGEHRGLLGLFFVPGDTPQPVEDQLFLSFLIDVDGEGNFSVSGLADGDYLLVLPPWLTAAKPLPESIRVLDLFGELRTLPALRVTVAGGEAVTGVEIPIMRLDATPTPLPPPGLPGSISGHITLEGFPGFRFSEGASVVSADVPQPIPIDLLQDFGVDGQNNFVVTGLEGGEYFLLVGGALFELVDPPGEDVDLLISEDLGVFTALGLRITLPDGGAVTGLEIVIARRDSNLGGPSTGAGPGGAGGATGRIAAGLAVPATLLLVGGVALRRRGRRLL